MQITWLGHGTFQFHLPSGEVIVMDPWIAFNPKYPEGHEFSRLVVRFANGWALYFSVTPTFSRTCN